MLRTITPSEMKRVETRVMRETSISGEALMQNAAAHVARAVCRQVAGRAGQVVCLCGTGNNGGDGLAAMRILMEENPAFRGECWLLPGRLSADAQRELDRLTEAAGSPPHVAVHRVEGDFAMPEKVACAIDALFGTGLSTAIVIVGIFFYDWRLALAAFWVVPAALLVMALTGKHQQRKAQAMEDARLEVADGVQEFLECAQEIRATNRSAAHLDALAAKLDAFERRQVASELTTGVFVTSAQAFLKLGIGTTVFVGATLLVSGQTDFMTYFAFLLVVTRVYDPVNLILQSIGELLSMRLSIRRTQELAAEKPMEGSTDFAPRGHDVVFEDVSFSYGDGEQVLRDVSFTAREGEVTALVGPSGSGKSTVAKLAARFWDADAGSVRVGGVNVADVDPETLLADYAEVFQDVVLFDDTVMGNIRLGRVGATDEEVLAAARAAMCDEFVSRMPQGYDMMIGENGGRLSGGERQRISIARAILKDAPVVLLDEATASLDVENETQVQQALSRLLAGKTVLVIAHRMRTVANADKIVVLKEGRVAEQGAPAELMAREGGLYRRMVELQTEASGWSLAS